MNATYKPFTFRASSVVTLCTALGWTVSASAFSLDPSTLSLDPPFTVNNPLMVASIALLVVGLIAQAIRRSREPAPPPDAPDLRWWKNS